MSFIHVEELQQQFIQNCDFQKTLLRKHTLETNTILFPPLKRIWLWKLNKIKLKLSEPQLKGIFTYPDSLLNI